MSSIYHIIYKTTNIINEKWYIGRHSTKNLNDSYLGSGVVLKQEIQKYGKENFKREILYSYDNFEDMVGKEKEILDKLDINDEMCYNMCVGNSKGMEWDINSIKCQEISRKLSESQKGTNNSCAKIDWDIVTNIRNLYQKIDCSFMDIHRQFDNLISVASIADIIRNRTWHDENYVVPDIKIYQGQYHPVTKLTPQYVLEIRSMKKEGFKVKYIAKKFGVSESAIYKILQNIRWRM